MVTSALYIRKYFDETTKKVATEMFEEIRKEFLQILQNIDWMDKNTKEKAIEKAEAITHYIGYPEELSNITKIEEYFDGVS